MRLPIEAIKIQSSNKEKLLSELKKKEPRIVGVDGEDGAGKSTIIAPLLAKRLYGAVLSIDDYLEKNHGGYAECLRYDLLRKDLAAFARKSKPIIIEGIILLDVLEKMGVKQDYFIYACSSMWLEDWTGEYGSHYERETLEEVIRQEEDKVKIMSAEYKMHGMRKELYAYTYKRRPFYSADALWISK